MDFIKTMLVYMMLVVGSATEVAPAVPATVTPTAAPVQIEQTAPRKTGAYAKSWAVRKTRETSNSLEVTVHSKNRYALAHLLENGHAKRGGGRVAAIPHIAPAEEAALQSLEQKIEQELGRL